MFSGFGLIGALSSRPVGPRAAARSSCFVLAGKRLAVWMLASRRVCAAQQDISVVLVAALSWQLELDHRYECGWISWLFFLSSKMCLNGQTEELSLRCCQGPAPDSPESAVRDVCI